LQQQILAYPISVMQLGEVYRGFTCRYENVISKLFWWGRTVEMEWYGRL